VESLEGALRAYAKPLWKPPIAIFRDERVLLPGDDLPTSIRCALESSEYMLFFANREAAASEWVRKELEIWCDELGRADRLIIIHIGDSIEVSPQTGEIIWEMTDALPAVLKRHVTQLPVWTELSWAETSAQRDIDNVEYRKAVNSIVARFQGKEPGDMNDTQVLTHRRNVRLRNIGVAAVVVSAVVALFFANQARTDRDRAEEERARAQISATNEAISAGNARESQRKAEESAQDADEQRMVAEEQRDAAIRARAIAEAQRRESEGRRLASQAQLEETQGPNRIDSSTILAVAAARASAAPEVLGVLRHYVESLLKPIWVAKIPESVSGLAFSHDGQRLVAVSRGVVEVWNTASGALDRTFELPHAKRRVRVEIVGLVPGGPRLVTSGGDGSIDEWIVSTGIRQVVLREPTEHSDVRPALSTDGTRIAWIDGPLNNPHLRVHSTDDGRQILDIVLPGRTAFATLDHDGSRALTFGPDDQARVWRVTPQLLLAVLPIKAYFGRFDDSGDTVAVASQQGFSIYRSESGKLIENLGNNNQRLDYSPDGQWAAIENPLYELSIRGVADGKRFGPFVLPGLSQVVFSTDSRRLLTMSAKGGQLWDVPAGREIARATRAGLMAIDPNSRYVAIAQSKTDDKRASGVGLVTTSSITVSDLSSSFEYRAFAPDQDAMDMAFAPDGSHLALASREGEFKRVVPWTWRELEGMTYTGVLQTARRNYLLDTEVFSPDGRYVSFVGRGNSGIVWDTLTNRRVLDMPISRTVSNPKFTADGCCVVLPQSGVDAWDIWSVSTGKRVGLAPIAADEVLLAVAPLYSRLLTTRPNQCLVLRGVNTQTKMWCGEDRPLKASFVRNTQMATVVFQSGTIWFIDTRSGQHTSMALRARLSYAEFSADGAFVLAVGHDRTSWVVDTTLRTISIDGTDFTALRSSGQFVGVLSTRSLQVWDTKAHSKLGEVSTGPERLLDFAIHRDGKFVAIALRTGIVRLAWIRPQELLDEACRRLDPQLTQMDWDLLGAGLAKENCRVATRAALSTVALH
jgi:WD40 repeat protein